MLGSDVGTVTFSVIVPTKGRPTLANALASVTSQLAPGDEIIVVCNDDNDFGNAARNSAIERARGTHLVFLDDDDEYVQGAFAAMRKFATDHPNRVGFFKVILGSWLVPPGFCMTAVGTLVPNIPGKVGRFAPYDPAQLRPLRPHETIEYLSVRWGDAEFMRSTLELRGDQGVEVPIITYDMRPEKSKWRLLRYRLRLRTRVRAGLATLRHVSNYRTQPADSG
jgi:glycosyltransferase involved in cell wall biosynthesis